MTSGLRKLSNFSTEESANLDSNKKKQKKPPTSVCRFDLLKIGYVENLKGHDSLVSTSLPCHPKRAANMPN